MSLGHATSFVPPALLVIAKAPVPGRVKTRLSPPCTPDQAAALARAALRDTLAAAGRASGAGRRVVVLDGEPGAWLPGGFDVIPQRGGGLAERLAAAFEDAGEPAFLVGMDTPQLTPELIDAGLAAVAGGGSAFGPALDGGYWGIGLPAPDAAVFAGVPMSTERTGAVQRERMAELGLEPTLLPPLRDVDTYDVALEVAGQAPDTHFARELSAVAAEIDQVAV
jgi:rSAM/selenodomain-associated transferase 1